MQIFEKNLSELKPYEKNPRRNDEAVQYVANSIKQFGWKQPIVIDKDNVIIAGHTRYKAAKELNIEKVPCVIAGDLTADQIKAYRIADNKTNDKATWDNAVLGEELKGLLDVFDMTDFGFGDFEISILTEDFEPEPFDDAEIADFISNGEVGLAKKRVIITYSEEDEEAMKELLGVEEIKKVVYDIKELS